MPVSALVRPGPAVVNTSTGRRVASDASTAANAAPASWRVWTSRIGLRRNPSANAAMPPPSTPNAWRTPSAASSRAISAEAVNALASDQRALPPHPTTSPSGAEGADGGSGVVTTG